MRFYSVKIRTANNKTVTFGFLSDSLNSAKLLVEELFPNQVVSIPKEFVPNG